MKYVKEIKEAFHLIVGSGSHVKLWGRILLSPFVLLAFLFACVYITLDNCLSK